MKLEPASRWVFAGLALIPLALLAEGLVLQHFQDVAPCPLCVLQRQAFFLYALVAISAAVHRPSRRGAALYAGGMAVISLTGLGVAIWHVWTLHHPKFGCGIDVMEQFVNNLPSASFLPWIFRATGDCSARHDPIFGLVVPEWALAWLALLLVLAVLLVYKCLSAAPERPAR